MDSTLRPKGLSVDVILHVSVGSASVDTAVLEGPLRKRNDGKNGSGRARTILETWISVSWTNPQGRKQFT